MATQSSGGGKNPHFPGLVCHERQTEGERACFLQSSLKDISEVSKVNNFLESNEQEEESSLQQISIA